MFYVYILFCSDKRLYIGYSENVKRRLDEHKLGKVHSTKHRLPFSVVGIECFLNQKDAKAREVYLKSGAGHQQIKRRHQHQLKSLGYRYL